VLKHGILQRYVVVFASKTASMSGGEVISSTDMPGRYARSATGRSGVPVRVVPGHATYKTAFGAAEVVEPAEPVDAVNRARARALAS
jgi:hypothetical protein